MNSIRNSFTVCGWSSTATPWSRRQWSRHHHLQPALLQISSSLRRRKNEKITTTHWSDQRVEMVIDVQDIANRASKSLTRFFRASESQFNGLVSSGTEAFNDLKTIVTIDSDQRIVIGCRRSSLHFLANFLLLLGLVVFAIRFAVKLGFGNGYGRPFGLVRRRDRSLAGREVVVERMRRQGKEKIGFNVSPLSPARGGVVRSESSLPKKPHFSTKREDRLPKWWPYSWYNNNNNKQEELIKEANRVIRAIMDNRMSGKDITEDDIIQVRRICKTSGARVCFETNNARDSFYRASVDFILNSCSSSTRQSTTVMIDGEDAREFVAGLADNIGIQHIHAARIVSAAVAARTRSWFLQAWALEMQGKRAEATLELSKICIIHQIFTPEESSAEMEMVSIGLEKHLREEQRGFLLKLLAGVCGDVSRKSGAEALGLKDRLWLIEKDSTPTNSTTSA